MNTGSEPQSLDANKMAGEIESNIVANMFVRLVQSHPKTAKILPDLAKSWDISPDHRTYTFHLREDAIWSDGKPILAEDVEYSWKRLLDPATGSVTSSVADVIKNAAAFRTGKVGASAVGVKAVDHHTLVVELATPVEYFLELIDYSVFAPLPKHVIEKLKKEGKEDSWTKPENIVVSGPYKLVEDHFKQYKIFEKNPSYYDSSKVKLKRIKAVIIEDYHADLNAYQTGQHDWSCCNSLPTEQLDQIKTKKDFQIEPFYSTYFYMVNTRKKPLDNPKVRKALSLAIDRKSIVENILRAGQKPTRDFVPVGNVGYVGIQSPIYDPVEAKKLLAEAGFPEGKNFPKISVKFNTADVHRKIAEVVQEMWKKTLHVNIELSNVEWSVFLSDQKEGKFQIMRRAWVGDYLDPYSFLSILLSDGSNNKSGWKNQRYDDLLRRSNEVTHRDERFSLFMEAEKIIAEEQPYIPIYFYTRPFLKKPYLRGFWPNLLDRHEWKYMWIDERWKKGIPDPLDIPDEPWVSSL